MSTLKAIMRHGGRRADNRVSRARPHAQVEDIIRRHIDNLSGVRPVTVKLRLRHACAQCDDHADHTGSCQPADHVTFLSMKRLELSGPRALINAAWPELPAQPG